MDEDPYTSVMDTDEDPYTSIEDHYNSTGDRHCSTIGDLAHGASTGDPMHGTISVVLRMGHIVLQIRP